MKEELIKLFNKFMKYEEDYIKKTEERANTLEELLKDYEVLKVPVLAPKWDFWLKVGGEDVKALPTALASGYVGPYIKDSSDLEDYSKPNLNFNSQLIGNGISTPMFYNAPSLAVSKETIIEAIKRGFEGYVKVVPVPITARNFIVGDLDKAKVIVVAHYDALWYGAVDNTSGLVASLFLMDKVKEVAFLLLGYTEVTLTNDYSGFVIREVGERLKEYLTEKRVLVLDCLGYRADFIEDPEYVEAYSPLFPDAIYGTPINELIKIYHSTLDKELDFDQLLKDLSRVLKYLRDVTSP